MASSKKYTLVYIAAIMLIAATCFVPDPMAAANKPLSIEFYLQQEFGTNELEMVPAQRPAVNGTTSGFGQQVVYEFVMTETANPNSTILGYVRGTAVSVNNTAASTTFFVQNVIHFNFYNGTISQQGEAAFGPVPWELSIVGGTGIFRNAYGYTAGNFATTYQTPAGFRHITNYYKLHVSYR